MGQKINPTGFRLSISRNWSSRWYANNRDFAGMLAEDIKVREYLKTKLKNAAVSRILIERPAKNARITIFSARPGVVIGKKGEDIEALKKELSSRLGVPVAVNIEEVRKPEIDAKLIADSITQQLEKRIMFRRAMKRAMQNAMRLGVPVAVNIEEIRKPEVDAQLIADSITQQLEKRIMFRRAMKRAMQNAMRLGAQGIKIMSSGRLNGIEIARCEWYREGRVPLHTLKADIDYGFSEAKTTYGVIGVKVWVYRGDRLAHGEAPSTKPDAGDDDRRSRRGPRPGGPGAPGGRGRPGDRPPRAAAGAAAPAADKPAEAGDAPKTAAAKRVRKAAAPGATAEGKGE